MNNTTPKVAQGNSADFSQVLHHSQEKSKFKISKSLYTSYNCSDIVPVMVKEILPGDVLNLNASWINRLSTPIYPTMSNLEVDYYAFFVPNRIVWDAWQELMGENKSSAWVQDTAPALVPVSQISENCAVGTIGDYYGLPTNTVSNSPTYAVNTLPFRGYALIWNEFFRDENLQAPLTVATDSNDDLATDVWHPSNTLLKACKPHDYFTSCLPAPQKGPTVSISLGGIIPVSFDNDSVITNTNSVKWSYLTGGAALSNRSLTTSDDGTSLTSTVTTPISTLTINNAYVSLDDVSAIDISDLRTLVSLQHILERDARGGTRYIEILKSHFGVEAEDYRLQRPEYLGHTKGTVAMHTVAQTSSTDTTTPQGNLAGFGVDLSNGSLVSKSFVEHGYLHILAVARQTKIYQQGLERFWTRRDRLDFYFPDLANISEQPVFRDELVLLGDQSDTIFGWQEAWADYRYENNKVTGRMRSDIEGGSLDAWHYGDYYTEDVTLSDEWIQDNSDTNVGRTLAITDTSIAPQIVSNMYFDGTIERCMPVKGIPGIDRI